MNPKRLSFYAVVALGAVFSAYAVSKSGSPGSAEVDRPVVFDLRSETLHQIQFSHAGSMLKLEPRREEHQEPYVRVTLVAGERQPVSFRGNRYSTQVIEGYRPLRAVRALGVLSGAQLGEGGLNDPSDTLVISSRDGEHRLILGSPTVSGDGRRALNPANGQVYILGRELLPTPEQAIPAMFERALHAFPQDEINRAVIECLGQRREARLGSRLDPPVWWAWEEDPEHPSQELTSWAGHLDNLVAVRPIAVNNPTQPVLTVTYLRDQQQRGFLKLWRCVHDEGQVHCVGASERTVGFVDLGGDAEQIIGDAERMVAFSRGERVDRPLH